MKILITGYKGQLGSDLVSYISSRSPGDELIGLDREECDLTDGPKLIRFVLEKKPDVIIHLAAFTAVDLAESKRLECYSINSLGTAYLVEAASMIGAKVLYISTDYVFDGLKKSAYTPDDQKNPLSTYGLSKSLGEEATLKWRKHFVIRTSWVFGKNGRNFVYSMLKLGSVGKPFSVVNDQIGSPTYTKDLCVLIDEMIRTEKYGIYHGTNEGYLSWFEFAQLIFKKAGLNPSLIIPISTAQYESAAKRPFNSRLDKTCLSENGFSRLPTVEDGLCRFLKEISNLANQQEK